MEECIDSLGDTTVLSKFDANGVYYQTKVEEADRDKPAFISHHGLYQSTRKSSGLDNASGTFQLIIDAILSFVRW